jgi:hypothetical protein
MAKNPNSETETQVAAPDPRIVEITVNVSRGDAKESVGARFNIEQLMNIGKTSGLEAANAELNKLTSKIYAAANEKVKEILK